MSDEPVIPTITNNGDRPETLIEQIAEAHSALNGAGNALAMMTPNGRNYIGEPEKFTAARRQHDARRQAVNDILRDLEKIVRGIRKQKRGAL